LKAEKVYFEAKKACSEAKQVYSEAKEAYVKASLANEPADNDNNQLSGAVSTGMQIAKG
jgi:hypothetical protein